MRLRVPVLVGLLAVLLVGTQAQAAEARSQTVTCEPGRFLSAAPAGAPIFRLLATRLPRRTSGYAPRCLVAESVATEVIRTAARNAGGVTSVRVFGARWNAGTWSVTTESSSTSTLYRARRGPRVVSFRCCR